MNPKTIHTIVHPFFLRLIPGRNDELYRRIAAEVVENPDSFLYYVATGPDIEGKFDSKHTDAWVNRIEIEFISFLRSLPQDVRDRIALLIDDGGEEGWHNEVYRPSRYLIQTSPHRQDFPLAWFAEHDSNSYFDLNRNRIYREITGMGNAQIQRLIGCLPQRYAHTVEGRTFFVTPLHPQVAKLARFLGIEPTDELILGENIVSIPDEVTHNTHIIGSGEYIQACVLADSVGLAVSLGIPVRNISLNSDQPHLRDEMRGYEFYRNPVETLYPRSREGETVMQGFRV